MKPHLRSFLLSITMFLSSGTAAMACAVCQGNPNSDLAKGAKAGVLILAVVTYSMLLGCAGIVATWIVRAKRREKGIDPLI